MDQATCDEKTALLTAKASHFHQDSVTDMHGVQMWWRALSLSSAIPMNQPVAAVRIAVCGNAHVGRSWFIRQTFPVASTTSSPVVATNQTAEVPLGYFKLTTKDSLPTEKTFVRAADIKDQRRLLNPCLLLVPRPFQAPVSHRPLVTLNVKRDKGAIISTSEEKPVMELEMDRTIGECRSALREQQNIDNLVFSMGFHFADVFVQVVNRLSMQDCAALLHLQQHAFEKGVASAKLIVVLHNLRDTRHEELDASEKGYITAIGNRCGLMRRAVYASATEVIPELYSSPQPSGATIRHYFVGRVTSDKPPLVVQYLQRLITERLPTSRYVTDDVSTALACALPHAPRYAYDPKQSVFTPADSTDALATNRTPWQQQRSGVLTHEEAQLRFLMGQCRVRVLRAEERTLLRQLSQTVGKQRFERSIAPQKLSLLPHTREQPSVVVEEVVKRPLLSADIDPACSPKEINLDLSVHFSLSFLSADHVKCISQVLNDPNSEAVRVDVNNVLTIDFETKVPQVCEAQSIQSLEGLQLNISAVKLEHHGIRAPSRDMVVRLRRVMQLHSPVDKSRPIDVTYASGLLVVTIPVIKQI